MYYMNRSDLFYKAGESQGDAACLSETDSDTWLTNFAKKRCRFALQGRPTLSSAGPAPAAVPAVSCLLDDTALRCLLSYGLPGVANLRRSAQSLAEQRAVVS